MFIESRTLKKSLSAPKERNAPERAGHFAPKELSGPSCSEFYKHFVPPGLKNKPSNGQPLLVVIVCSGLKSHAAHQVGVARVAPQVIKTVIKCNSW